MTTATLLKTGQSTGTKMNLTFRTIVTLSSALLAAILLDLVACEPNASNSSLGKERVPRKYLEVEDLNKYESSVVTVSHVENPRLKRSPQQQQQSQQLRVTRQKTPPAKPRPGFLWTLARVTFESFNDTRSAVQQISKIFNDAVPNEAPKKMKKPTLPPKPSASLKTNETVIAGTTATTLAPTTTTEEFILTRPLLQNIIRRNVKGLVRLFNIEWQDAMNQSKQTVAEFRRDLGKQIGMYLQDNPNAYR